MMMKQKRTPEKKMPLYVARGFVAFSLVYAALAALQMPILVELYQTIAGFMFTFFWPIVVFCAFLILLAADYGLKGLPLKARATRLVLVGIAVMSAGAFAAVRAILSA